MRRVKWHLALSPEGPLNAVLSVWVMNFQAAKLLEKFRRRFSPARDTRDTQFQKGDKHWVLLLRFMSNKSPANGCETMTTGEQSVQSTESHLSLFWRRDACGWFLTDIAVGEKKLPDEESSLQDANACWNTKSAVKTKATFSPRFEMNKSICVND